MTLSFFQMSQHGHRGPAVIELKLLDPVCTVELHTATPLTSTRASKSLLQENERVLIAHSAPVLGAMQRSPACPIADKAGRSTRSPVALEFGRTARTPYLSLFPVLQARVNEIGVALLRHSLGVATGSFFAQPSDCFAQPSDSVHRDPLNPVGKVQSRTRVLLRRRKRMLRRLTRIRGFVSITQ